MPRRIDTVRIQRRQYMASICRNGYRVRVTYQGGYDAEIEWWIRHNIGPSHGSGSDLITGERDHDWYFSKLSRAQAHARKLRHAPWPLDVTVMWPPRGFYPVELYNYEKSIGYHFLTS